jgi:hypothetical protein
MNPSVFLDADAKRGVERRRGNRPILDTLDALDAVLPTLGVDERAAHWPLTCRAKTCGDEPAAARVRSDMRVGNCLSDEAGQRRPIGLRQAHRL